MIKKIKISVSLTLCLMFLVNMLCITTCFAEDNMLSGNGTKNNPYLITNAGDLVNFADSVNNGTDYSGKYVCQTADIDMTGVEFTTIGLFDGGNFFCGTYNGCGHVISNIEISVGGNNALFGKLGGTVMNLGIESGNISGACVGAIASHSSSAAATIINCYNKATVNGKTRAGGIADNFNGTIANCWTDCELNSGNPAKIGGIVSYTAKTMRSCYSFEEQGRSKVIKEGAYCCDKSYDKAEIVSVMNKNIYSLAAFCGISYSDLYLWTLNDNGEIAFSSSTANFQFKYFPQFARFAVVTYLPYFFVVAFLAAVIVVVGKSKKIRG